VETGIFTPEEFRQLLHAAPPHLLLILVIGGFAGMRRAEMNRLDWNAIDLDRRITEVRAGYWSSACQGDLRLPPYRSDAGRVRRDR
jgi:integrase